MPIFIMKLMAGHTDAQIKARNKRFPIRRASLEETLGGGAAQMEYPILDDTLAAFVQTGGPYGTKPTLIQSYILDWRRNEKHGGTQSWYALCNNGEVVPSVVWTLIDRTKNGGLTQGGNSYHMITTGADDDMKALNFA